MCPIKGTEVNVISPIHESAKLIEHSSWVNLFVPRDTRSSSGPQTINIVIPYAVEKLRISLRLVPKSHWPIILKVIIKVLRERFLTQVQVVTCIILFLICLNNREEEDLHNKCLIIIKQKEKWIDFAFLLGLGLLYSSREYIAVESRRVYPVGSFERRYTGKFSTNELCVWVFFLICCSIFWFLLNVRLKLTFKIQTIFPSNVSSFHISNYPLDSDIYLYHRLS